mmetsp:Transcript_35381/g.40962  ORF Transcript_35381/g.40962 Transcript_35381/m.40962 type:complete len:89 (-) Transcript_35381:94-360(-)
MAMFVSVTQRALVRLSNPNPGNPTMGIYAGPLHTTMTRTNNVGGRRLPNPNTGYPRWGPKMRDQPVVWTPDHQNRSYLKLTVEIDEPR